MRLDEIKEYLGDTKRGLIQEIFNAIKAHCFFLLIPEAHKNNPNNQLITNNIFFQNFLHNGYAANQLITIGRLIDKSRDTISLNRIITELKESKDFNQLETCDIDLLDRLEKLLDKNESLKIIKRDRNKIIAHKDIEHFSTAINTRIEDIEEALIVVAYVAKTLNYILFQNIETFRYYSFPKDIFKCLDSPFFFSDEVDKLTKKFYEFQIDIDEKIKKFVD